jgi:2-methylcitrate dehydratase PrpD
VAQAGVECAQLALRGLSGPVNFLTGVYGYPVLYGRGRLDPLQVVAGLADEWRLNRMMFKPYPSCGATQGLTALTLQLVDDFGLTAEAVHDVEVRQPPYSHRLVGQTFKLGPNPRVDAQFSAAWCVANAIVRGGSRLDHFRAAAVADPAVLALAARVRSVADAAMDARGHTAVDLLLTTSDGQVHRRGLDIAPGFPGRGLSEAQHMARWRDCLDYAPMPPTQAQAQGFLDELERLHRLPDARVLLRGLVVDGVD